MVQVKASRKVVKVLAKGQVTIPREYRKALGIKYETLLNITLVGDHLEVTPLRQGDDTLRRYTEEDISRFLEEDKLDKETVRKVRRLLRRGTL